MRDSRTEDCTRGSRVLTNIAQTILGLSATLKLFPKMGLPADAVCADTDVRADLVFALHELSSRFHAPLR